jgi:hypothetical protein
MDWTLASLPPDFFFGPAKSASSDCNCRDVVGCIGAVPALPRGIGALALGAAATIAVACYAMIGHADWHTSAGTYCSGPLSARSGIHPAQFACEQRQFIANGPVGISYLLSRVTVTAPSGN